MPAATHFAASSSTTMHDHPPHCTGPLHLTLQLVSSLVPVFMITLFPVALAWALIRWTFLRLPFVVYVAWYMFFDNAPVRGGNGRVSRRWRNVMYLPGHLLSYLGATLHREAELDPAKGPYLLGIHPHGVLCYSGFLNIITDVGGFPTLFPHIDRRVAVLSLVFQLPIVREIALIHGLISVERNSIRHWLSRGTDKAVGIVVGGAAESLESVPGCHRVVLRRRRGFFKLALENGASLVPVYSFGENQLWTQIRHPLLCRLQRRFLALTGFTIPICYGRWFTPIPYAHKLVTIVGAPIPVRRVAKPTEQDVVALREVYMGKLREMFDRYKGEYAQHRIEELKFVA
ncbi:diacylglycerol acyltransferase [Fimicolochytrium jonesii]|uniref:diacylglycerol acyltransferase n=1 Tax=Fimicolochytrium jonesii TaxID=1396493 RepID=UPI0022FE41DB|nr:diacylglycerol acyltransferase [Fimicolochytrium jonesii]KAI8823351.1 diacylglycerol acyltransferase [Fimicolochytrium jonesii]